MKKFVELIQRTHQERFKLVIDKIIGEKIPVALLSNEPLEKVICLLRENHWDLNICQGIVTIPPPHEIHTDFKITSLADVDKIHPRPEYILTPNYISTRVSSKYLPDCKTLMIGSRTLSEQFYEEFMTHLSQLKEIYESFMDEESRRVFRGYWLGQITRRFSEFVHSYGEHYISEGFIPEPGSVFFDVGVCDGATSLMFAKMGCKVYGFEMDKQNFEIAAKVAKENKFTVENVALGAYNHEMRYVHAPNGNEGASRFDSNGTETARVVTLDSYVKEKGISRVDCIKLDVEGAELDVLMGAASTIARWKPILLLSAYHKANDFWTLMNFVKSIRSDYCWALRQYSETRESLPSLFVKITPEYLRSLNLEPNWQDFGECCLLAR